jgi:uncharacterized protein involved in exopolysaccharide biosynthesis
MTTFDSARQRLAAVPKQLAEKLPSREQVETQISSLGAQLEELSGRVEKLREAVSPSVRDLAGTVREAAVRSAQQAAAEAPKHKKKIQKAADRARRDVLKALEEFQAPEPPKPKRHIGTIVLLSLVGAAVAGAAYAAVRAVTLADEQWIGVDEDLKADREAGDDAPETSADASAEPDEKTDE